MNALITLTDSAVSHIKQMLAKHVGGVGFRLSIKKTGCSGYAYVPTIIENIKNDDIYFLAQDELPVYIDPACQTFLQGLVIDYVVEVGTGLNQKRLVFVNPNEKDRCGCGESFTIE